ncbi:MAG: sugar ABC transporter substrate-binding protein [Lachnospiraceae bacterium]|nr:sugar ABC transporter substrate-binding protein [Lachnospiraceae bacterium]
MKKKIVSVLLSLAMVSALVAGCGSSAANTAAPAADAAATEAAPAAEGEAPAADAAATEAAPAAAAAEAGSNSLTVWAWDANFNIPALKAAEADYKANVDPDFTLNIVEQSQSSDVENAITLAGSSGDYSALPDIVLFQDHYIQRYVADYPDAWNDMEAAGIDWSDFGAEKLSYSTIDGKHFGVPVDNGTAIMAYRVDLLEQAGYTIDDMTGITWDKFIEVGKAVYEKTGKYLLCMDGDGNDLIYMMLQAEGQSQFKDGVPVFVDNPTLVEVVGLIVKMANEKVLYLANDWSDYTDQAIQGDMVAGVMNGNWIIPTIEQVADNSGKWEITSLPTIKGGEGYAANGGSSLYITSNSKNVELAQKFLASTFGAGSTATYDDALKNGGVITCSTKASKSDVYQTGVDYFNKQPIYSKIVEMGTHVPVVEQNDYHYSARQVLATAIQNAIAGADLQAEIAQAESDLKFEMGIN